MKTLAFATALSVMVPMGACDEPVVLSGTPITQVTLAALMEAWRGILPGFNATWHELGPVSVTITGNTASATAFVDGRHWLGDRRWRPVGNDHWVVERIAATGA